MMINISINPNSLRLQSLLKHSIEQLNNNNLEKTKCASQTMRENSIARNKMVSKNSIMLLNCIYLTLSEENYEK